MAVADLHRGARGPVRGGARPLHVLHGHLAALEGGALADGAGAILHLDAPQHGVAPGQAAVFYDGDRVLGGGWIDGAG